MDLYLPDEYPGKRQQAKERASLEALSHRKEGGFDVVAAHRLLRGQRALVCALPAVVLDRNSFLRSALESRRVRYRQRNRDAVVPLLVVIVARIRTGSRARRAVAKIPDIARHT